MSLSLTRTTDGTVSNALEQWPDMDAALAQAHQKLAARFSCRPARRVTPG
jgi:hypothetical protein